MLGVVGTPEPPYCSGRPPPAPWSLEEWGWRVGEAPSALLPRYHQDLLMAPIPTTNRPWGGWCLLFKT